MESSSIPTAGNATIEEQAPTALLRAEYNEFRDSFNEFYTISNEIEAVYNKWITQKYEIKHELQFRVLKASHDMALEDASIYKASLESTQALIKALLEQKQMISKSREAVSKVFSVVEAVVISKLLAEESDGASTAEI